jgi:two-component system, chemotaxis family, sensor kinase CheA
MAPTDTAHPARDATLNRAAVELLTAPSDAPAALARVRALLEPLTRDAGEADWVREALSTGVQLLDEALADDGAHGDVATRVSVLLELIMRGDRAGEEPGASVAEYTLPADVVQSLFPEFLTESFDYLEQVERSLLHLRSDGSDTDAVDLVFRAFHTIKSTAAVLGVQPISTLAHNAESVLSLLRDNGSIVSTAHADLVLQCTDMMRDLLGRAEVALDGAAFVLPQGYPRLLQQLQLAERQGVGTECPQPAPYPASPPTAMRAERAEPEPARARASATMRVRTERLDHLLNLIGELVVAQSMTSQDALVREDRHGALARKVAHTGKIVRELQQLGTSLRMVPLRPVFQRMERLVRDLAHASGKQVQFITSGEDTEIDRNMVDVIADPLVHMIRNAMDHGLELPAQRAAAGKIVTGTLRVAAWHAGGDVVVELHDDGRGVDLDRLLARAVQRGLVDAERTLPHSEICNLMFAPGLSTSDTVTAISGRGVGMDVVRRNVEALRGRIEIATTPGAGTTFTLRLPLTLAIADGMLVRVGSERFIVPTVDIQMSFRPTADSITDVAGAGELVTLHGAVLPIVRLHALLNASNAQTRPEQGLLVVVGEGAERCALLVDDLLGQQQFVARPVGDSLGAVPGIAGAAILGDGCVGLILDIAGIVALR